MRGIWRPKDEILQALVAESSPITATALAAKLDVKVSSPVEEGRRML